MEIGDVKDGGKEPGTFASDVPRDMVHDEDVRLRMLNDAESLEDLEKAERMRTTPVPFSQPRPVKGSRYPDTKPERKKPVFKRVAPPRITFDVEVLEVIHFGHGSVLDLILDTLR